MVRRRLHSSSKARVEAFRAKHAGKRRVELFITEHALGCLDRLASAQGQTRSETIEGLLLKAPSVPVNVSGNTAKRTVNVSGNVAAISPEVRELVFGWRAEGASWAECARRLDERGILPPRGGRWLFENGGTNLGRYFA